MLNEISYHFAPAKNWMNDPNGTVYRDGTYHLFYQYNPTDCKWGNICWAYATSEDLVNWKRMGIRLAPETAKGEQYCFSGCAVPRDDGYILAYTSIGFEPWAIQQHARQRFARANADFTEIERLYTFDLDENSQPFPVHEWRDPFIFFYNGTPYLLLCGVCWKHGTSENGVLLYRASDASMTRWQFVSVLYTDPDHVIECPNMLISGGKAALVYSTMTDRKVKYVSGDFDGVRLWERNRGVVDFSLTCFYATNLSDSRDGQKILYGWMGEDLEESDSPDGVHSGCLALPRTVRLDDRYRLCIAPIPALDTLEGETLRVQNGEVVSDTVRARVRFTTDGDCRLRLTENEREYITVRVRGDEVLVGRMSRFPRAGEREERVKVAPGRHTFDVFIDGSATELFIDGEAALSIRMYRAFRPEKLLSVKEGIVENVRACKMRAAIIEGE